MTREERKERLLHIKQIGALTNKDREAINISIKELEQEPRKIGKWIDCGVSARCSNCGSKDYYYSQHRYCPYCGAEMESEE